MEKIDVINEFIKMIFISLYTFYVYTKIINYKNKDFYRFAIIISFCILISTIYTVLLRYINPVPIILFLYFLYDIVMAIITNNKINYSTLVMIISFTIVYATYIFSTIIAGLLIYYLKVNINISNPIINLVIHLIEVILLLSIMRLKRIRNGLKFLRNQNKAVNITMYIVLIGGIILTILGMLKGSENELLNTFLMAGIILIFISLVAWIQNQITNQYREDMRNRTIEIQKKEIDEQLNIIKDIKEENFRLAKAIHKYNNRLFALELGIKNTIEQNYKTEFAEELSSILEETENISKGFSEETTIKNKTLPLTNITGIDNMFKYMQKEANRSNINFDLKINESINYLIENTISKEKLETLIGDHLKDAIIAVNSSDNSYKSILAILGRIEDCYEFSVYDTGIEFDIEVLLKLGIEPITTHKETGGSGIGFMTTFETLKECKASLIIEEYNPETTNYTKSVTIRFDNNNEYKIRTYRTKEIRKLNKDKRIIIENI